jgi:hypothetical protein
MTDTAAAVQGKSDTTGSMSSRWLPGTMGCLAASKEKHFEDLAIGVDKT